MTGRVLVDIQGTQSIDHRDRGVARYIIDLATALHERHGQRVGPFLLTPDRTPPGGIEPFVAAGALASIDEVEPRAGDVYHVASPYELTVPLRRHWPPAVRDAGARLAVTLYDVIPEVFADRYLTDPGLRRRYRARHHLVRQADAVLAISQATADDAVDRLGLDPAKVTV
ncbi:MAG: glycosyltransferase, partial [Actinomycetota bacterium]